MLKLRLQLFAEGTAAPASAPEGGATGGQTAGQETQAANGQPSPEEQFQSMIQGQYRDQYEQAVGQRVQAAIQQRFRNNRNYEKQIAGYAPIMQALGAKYGKDPSDVEGITKLLTDDDSLYAEEASKRGLPVGTYKTMLKLEAENKRLSQEKQLSEEERARQAHFQSLAQQAEELKKTFPDFDLMRELQTNERFLRMTAPGVGISVKDAYYAIHGEDIQRQSMQYAAQQATRNVANSVRAGASRPLENGVGNQQPARLGVDVAHMDKATREEYKRRIKAGEIINFVDKI